MTATYEDLRAAVQALTDAPGRVTKTALRALLARYPEPPRVDGFYADDSYDPQHYA